MAKGKLFEQEEASNNYLFKLIKEKSEAKKVGNSSEAYRLHVLIRTEQKKKKEIAGFSGPKKKVEKGLVFN